MSSPLVFVRHAMIDEWYKPHKDVDERIDEYQTELLVNAGTSVGQLMLDMGVWRFGEWGWIIGIAVVFVVVDIGFCVRLRGRIIF